MKYIYTIGIAIIAGVTINYVAYAAPAKKTGSAPIEITSDKLVIKQKETQAIFSGNVEAKQGEVHLRSEKMVVHYREGGNDVESAGSVSKVDVNGNVFLSTKSETASSKNGILNVDNDTITLEGDVTLTQGKNIIKGGKMVHNMATGVSEMVSGEHKGTDGRVYMYAVPSSKEKKKTQP